MRRDELPAEADRRPLSYPELIDVLEALVGETVIVRADAATDEPARAGGLAVSGALTVESAGPDRADLSIADAGRLLLSADSVTGATLTTYDGNDFFLVVVTMPGLTVQIQDENSGGLI